MRNAVFGQREVKSLAYAHEGILKEYADYKNGGEDTRKQRGKKHQLSRIDRVLSLITVFALAFAGINMFMPDTAVAAARTVGQIVGIG
jgi:hypothetical protein